MAASSSRPARDRGEDAAATCQHTDAVVSPSGDITCKLCGAVKPFRGEWPDRSAAYRTHIKTCGSGKFVNYYLRVRYGC